MIEITFNSFLDWKIFAKQYCEEWCGYLDEMPSQEWIDTEAHEILTRAFADEYDLCLEDVIISNELEMLVEDGIRAYISEELERNTVSAKAFEGTCEILNSIRNAGWTFTHVKEDHKYTMKDFCTLLHDWLEENDTY